MTESARSPSFTRYMYIQPSLWTGFGLHLLCYVTHNCFYHTMAYVLQYVHVHVHMYMYTCTYMTLYIDGYWGYMGMYNIHMYIPDSDGLL